MRRSKTLAKLRAGKTARICSLGHFIPAYIRHAAQHNFDCIWLDLEHRNLSDHEAQTLLAFFHLSDIDCLLRAPTRQKTRLYRYLEDGATGLMIPLVSTAKEAEEIVQSTKFPPIGQRGLDGAGLDGDFYLSNLETYPEDANRETFIVVQIETPEAVRNAEAIAAVPGIDGLFIGPGDLGLRIKRSPGTPTMDQSIEMVAAAAKKHGKWWGQPAGSLEQMQKLHALGGRILAHGGDFGAMMQMFERATAVYDQACAGE